MFCYFVVWRFFRGCVVLDGWLLRVGGVWVFDCVCCRCRVGGFWFIWFGVMAVGWWCLCVYW